MRKIRNLSSTYVVLFEEPGMSECVPGGQQHILQQLRVGEGLDLVVDPQVVGQCPHGIGRDPAWIHPFRLQTSSVVLG